MSRVLLSLFFLLLPVRALADLYYNSAEPNCFLGNTAGVVACDDFDDGVWFTTGSFGQADADGWCRYSGPSPANAISVIGQGIGGSGYAAHSGPRAGAYTTATLGTSDTAVTINPDHTMATNGGSFALGFADPPAGCEGDGSGGCEICSYASITGSGASTTMNGISAACHNATVALANSSIGTAGGINTADMKFDGNHNELWVRVYFKWVTPYVFNGMKYFGVYPNNFCPCVAGLGLIGIGFNVGQEPSINIGDQMIFGTRPAELGYEGYIGFNVSDFNPPVDQWTFVEMHVILNSVGSDNGTLQVWADSCGPTGTASNCEPGDTPTLRINRSDITFRISNEGGLSCLEKQNYSNPPGSGTDYMDNIKVSTTGPLGFSSFGPSWNMNGSLNLSPSSCNFGSCSDVVDVSGLSATGTATGAISWTFDRDATAGFASEGTIAACANQSTCATANVLDYSGFSAGAYTPMVCSTREGATSCSSTTFEVENWNVDSFTLHTPSTCVQGACSDPSDISAAASGFGAPCSAISWLIDCDTTGGFSGVDPNTLGSGSSCTNSSTCNRADVCNYSAFSQGTYTAQIQSTCDGNVGTRTTQILISAPVGGVPGNRFRGGGVLRGMLERLFYGPYGPPAAALQ